jgi:hypothetical protein
MDALDVPHTPGPCSTQATTPSLNKGQDRLPTGNPFLLLVAVHKTKSFGCWAASRSGNAIFALRITREMTVGSCLAACLPKCQREKGLHRSGIGTEQARSYRGHLSEDEVIPGGGKTAGIFHRTCLAFHCGERQHATLISVLDLLMKPFSSLALFILLLACYIVRLDSYLKQFDRVS